MTTFAEMLERYSPAIAMVAALGGEDLAEMVFKLFAVETLVAERTPGTILTTEEIVILIEDFEAPIAIERRIELLLESGVLRREAAGTYRLSDAIAIHQLFPRELRAARLDVPLEALSAIVNSKAEASRAGSRNGVQPGTILSAVSRSTRWALDVITYCIDHGLRGVPVFWPCADGKHTPMGVEVGTTATFESLLLLVEPAHHGFSNGHGGFLADPVLLDFLQMLLGLQRRNGSWYDGSFAVWGFDDDFVGSFLSSIDCPDCPPGPCPTVDGTAAALLCLILVVQSGLLAQPDDSDRRFELRQSCHDAIVAAVRFLLRMQLDSGAWGIYRYEQDEHSVRPRELASRSVIEALAEASSSGLLEEELFDQIATAVRRYVEWTRSTRHEENSGTFWMPEFTTKEATERERLYSTAWVVHSLLFVLRGWDEHSPALVPIIRRGIGYLSARWSPDPEAFASTEVRSPAWNGPARGTMTWEIPGDPIMASLFLQYHRDTRITMPDETWARVNEAIGNFLHDELHGHWTDFLMRREGNDRAMPSNTLHYNRSLLEYLHYLRSALEASPAEGSRSDPSWPPERVSHLSGRSS